MNQSTSPFVSVIVPTYNREEVLCDTLRNLFEQDYSAYEVIVVDQTPTHMTTTAQFLEHAQATGQIRYIFLSTPNLPGARNAGIEAAKGDIVAFCDDDVILERDWISCHVAAHVNRDIAAVAGRVVDQRWVDLGIKGKPTAVFLADGRFTMGFARSEPDYVEGFPGGNCSIRRSIFATVGFFDVGYIGNALREESDLAIRISRAGYRIFFEPRAALIHRGVPAGGCRAPTPAQHLYEFHRNDARFFLKNFGLTKILWYLWRYKLEIVFPGTLRLALHSKRWQDLFVRHAGFIAGIRSYLQWHQSVNH